MRLVWPVLSQAFCGRFNQRAVRPVGGRAVRDVRVDERVEREQVGRHRRNPDDVPE